MFLLRSFFVGTKTMLFFMTEKVFLPMGRFGQCTMQVHNAQKRREGQRVENIFYV